MQRDLSMAPVNAAADESSPPLPGDRDAWTFAAAIATDGLWYYDVSRGEARLSPRAMELLGYQPDAKAPDIAEVRRHVNASDLPLLQRTAQQIIHGERNRADMELRLLTEGGES